MRPRRAYERPVEQDELWRRAVRLQWVSIAFMVSIIAAMGFVMGSSQAMKTAWAEDALSLVPPAAFLIAARYYKRPPTTLTPTDVTA